MTLQCNATCGEAYQTRNVTCLSDAGMVVNSTLCDESGSPRPDTSRSCYLTDCLVYGYVAGAFGNVSLYMVTQIFFFKCLHMGICGLNVTVMVTPQRIVTMLAPHTCIRGRFREAFTS